MFLNYYEKLYRSKCTTRILIKRSSGAFFFQQDPAKIKKCRFFTFDLSLFIGGIAGSASCLCPEKDPETGRSFLFLWAFGMRGIVSNSSNCQLFPLCDTEWYQHQYLLAIHSTNYSMPTFAGPNSFCLIMVHSLRFPFLPQ